MTLPRCGGGGRGGEGVKYKVTLPRCGREYAGEGGRGRDLGGRVQMESDSTW